MTLVVHLVLEYGGLVLVMEEILDAAALHSSSLTHSDELSTSLGAEQGIIKT